MGEENAWVFDSLVCFLHGPVWNAPILTFIEEKSLIFDPNSNDNDNPEFRKLHEEYKNLVDFMLGSFMEEMCITPDQFETACLEGKSNQDGLPLPFQRGLFQQIWAANDINKFVDMMKKRNIEIQLQALELIERRCGAAPKSCTAQDNDGVLEEILQQVAAEPQAEEAQVHRPESSGQTGSQVTTDAEIQNAAKSPYDPIQNLTFENKTKVNAEELEKRQLYLKAQRDKLIAMKKEIRTKRLMENGNSARPTSSKAQQVLSGALPEPTQSTNKPGVSGDLNITLRKALARRLKDEVVKPE